MWVIGDQKYIIFYILLWKKSNDTFLHLLLIMSGIVLLSSTIMDRYKMVQSYYIPKFTDRKKENSPKKQMSCLIK